jgi:hypothetical protein
VHVDWLGTASSFVGVAGGLVGTALGVYNLFSARRWEERRVSVKLTDTGFIFDKDSNLLIVSALNVGFRPVILQQAGIRLPNGGLVTTQEPVIRLRLPVQLSAGASCDFVMNVRSIAGAVQEAGYGTGVQVRGYYQDALGTLYLSRVLCFDPYRFPADSEG